MGEWDSLIVALLKERNAADGLDLDDDNLIKQFRAHLNRGVGVTLRAREGTR